MHQIIPFTNTPQFLTSVVPSSSTVSTADELSRFAEILRRGGELDGVRVMSAETLRAATASAAGCGPTSRRGWCRCAGAPDTCWGPSGSGRSGAMRPRAFGHTGLTNIAVWADPSAGLAAAVVSSGKPGGHREAKRYPAAAGPRSTRGDPPRRVQRQRSFSP